MNIRLAALGHLLNRQAVNLLVIEESIPGAIANRVISVEAAQHLKAAVDAACVAHYLVEREVVASCPPSSDPPCGCVTCARAYAVLVAANDPLASSLPKPPSQEEHEAYWQRREEEEQRQQKQAVSLLASKLPPGLADALLGRPRGH